MRGVDGDIVPVNRFDGSTESCTPESEVATATAESTAESTALTEPAAALTGELLSQLFKFIRGRIARLYPGAQISEALKIVLTSPKLGLSPRWGGEVRRGYDSDSILLAPSVSHTSSEGSSHANGSEQHSAHYSHK